MKRLSTLFLVLAGLVAFPAPAFAGYFTVYGWATFWEDRQDVSNATGTHLFDNHHSNQPMPGLRVELWDRDGLCADFLCQEPEGDDDLLAIDYTSSSGYYEFPNIGDLEDIYVVTTYEVSWGQMLIPMGDAWKIGTRPVEEDFGVGLSGSYYKKNFSITCWDNYDNNTDGWCNNDDSHVKTHFSDYKAISNILATITDVDEYVSDYDLSRNSHSNRFNAHWPDGPGTKCSDSSLSWGYDDFCIKNGSQLNNHTVAHEIGHNVHRRALNYSGALTDGSCNGGHGWTSFEEEKCATAEGWADFFAGAVYWADSAPDPWYQIPGRELEGDTQAGNDYYDRCVSYHDQNPWAPEQREGNVARFFWDLFDSTLVDENSSGPCTCGGSCPDGYDNADMSLTQLIDGWDDFPWGTANNHSHEEDNVGHDDGRNAWDYEASNSWSCSELHLNCLDRQDEN